MTSTLANNNRAVPRTGKKHYLETDGNGVPIQLQVPRTVSYYSGAGGVEVVPVGTDFLYVSGLGTGVLKVDLADNQDYNNMIGRVFTVYLDPAAGNNISVDITGGPVARAFRLTGDTGDTATITPGGWASFAFIDTVNCLIVGSANCTIA